MTEEARNLILVYPRQEDISYNKRLEEVLETSLSSYKVHVASGPDELGTLIDLFRDNGYLGRILFAIPLGISGINIGYYRILECIRRGEVNLKGYVGGVITDSLNDLYTKTVASEIVLAANEAGCTFVGRALVEGTGSLSNYEIMAANWHTDVEGAYKRAASELAKQLFDETPVRKDGRRPKLLVLHASIRETSNTMALWAMVKSRLTDIDITEVGLRNGTVSDCAGCAYRTCLHFGEQGSCFYGGVMVDDVYPAVKEADAVLLLCPNYNDSLSANLTAFINRLTALFRINRFYEKSIFGIIVSGYSGSEIIARQLICAMNMNKSFRLPGNFSMMVTANAAGTAVMIPGIEDKTSEFAANIMNALKD